MRGCLEGRAMAHRTRRSNILPTPTPSSAFVCTQILSTCFKLCFMCPLGNCAGGNGGRFGTEFDGVRGERAYLDRSNHPHNEECERVVSL